MAMVVSAAVNIGDSAYIASPLQKLVAFVRHSNKVDRRVSGMDRNPLTGGGYRTAIGAGDGEAIPTFF